MIDNKFTQISFFSGCGGSSTGFYQAKDFIELLAVEINEHSIKSFHLNYPNVPITNLVLYQSNATKKFKDENSIGINKNLTKDSVIPLAVDMYPSFNDGKTIDLANIADGELDVLAASPPCQDFSSANTKKKFKPNSEKNRLFFDTIEYIKAMRPKVAIIENVPGMITSKEMKKTFLYILKDLHESEYVFRFNILNASHYGVPQSRDRVIFICVRKDVASKITDKEDFDTNWWPEPIETNTEELSLTYNVPRAIYSSSGEFQNKIIDGNRIIGTITKTPSMSFHDENFNDLKPSIREIKKLCGFPEDYLLYDNTHHGELNPDNNYQPYTNPNSNDNQEFNYNEKYNRLGNAVPPLMMRAIATSIKEKILIPYYQKTKLENKTKS